MKFGAGKECTKLKNKLGTEMTKKDNSKKIAEGHYKTNDGLDGLKEILNEKVQALVKDAVKAATQMAEEELRKSKRLKPKSKSKRA